MTSATHITYSTYSRLIGAQYSESEVDWLRRLGSEGWLLTAVRDDHRDRVYYFAKEEPAS